MQSIARLLPTGPEDASVHHGARRKSTRYPVHGEVSVTSPIVAEGFLFNASAGGLRVALDQRVDPGDRLDMQIRFDHLKHTHERGEVVWTRELPDGWLVGLRFV